MTIAEIHGKISESGSNLSERREDLLTSNIFGCMRYLPPQSILIPFLHTSRSFHGNKLEISGNIIHIRYEFWPWLKHKGRRQCQPDIIIGLQDESQHIHLVMVEAKYHSGLLSESDGRTEPNNQLARELDNLNVLSGSFLGWGERISVASRTLLFITEDISIPQDLLQRSWSEYTLKRKEDCDIFWASWRFLPEILEKQLDSEVNLERRAVMDDMLMLLYRKWLIMFNGVDPITQTFQESDFVFYQRGTTVYRWPRLVESELLPSYAYRLSSGRYGWPSLTGLLRVSYEYTS